jgi:hypothetical protein
VICARIRVADTPDRFPVMAMSESSKRARAAVGDRRRSAPHAGLAFAVNSDQVLRITVLAFAPVAGARAGGALWARAAGRAGGGACGLRFGVVLFAGSGPAPGTPVMIRSQHPPRILIQPVKRFWNSRGAWPGAPEAANVPPSVTTSFCGSCTTSAVDDR